MRALLFLTMGLISSCSKSPESPAARSNPVATPAANQPLFDRLVAEAAQRDKADPPTSKVLAALQAAGLPLEAQRQQLGQAIGATHCLMLNTRHHVTLSVCEFADERSAGLGADTSREALQQIAGLSVHRKRSTVLSVIDSQADDVSGLTARKALEVFDAL